MARKLTPEYVRSTLKQMILTAAAARAGHGLTTDATVDECADELARNASAVLVLEIEEEIEAALDEVRAGWSS